MTATSTLFVTSSPRQDPGPIVSNGGTSEENEQQSVGNEPEVIQLNRSDNSNEVTLN